MPRRKLQQETTFSPPQISSTTTSPPSSNDVSPSIMITVLILAIAVILSASLYLLLRFLRRHHHHRSPPHLPHSLSSSSAHPSRRQVSPVDKNPLLDTLPIFSFSSLAGKHNAGDCAVCLSKFESNDTLRLLPVCCHAFHVECIDTWLNTNQTCPLCRSPAFPSENELNGKLAEHSRSFRVELGHVSNNNSGEIRRSYSLGGSFDYIVPDDVVMEIPAGSFRRNSVDVKVDAAVDERGVLAGEVGTRGGGGGWLKDYLSNSLSSSRTASFRSSGRWFFTGSSRRTTVDLPVGNNELADYEASRLGEEIGELFRWLSGV